MDEIMWMIMSWDMHYQRGLRIDTSFEPNLMTTLDWYFVVYVTNIG